MSTSQAATAAQLYLENSSNQKDHATELMSMLSVPYGGLVLDLGCGTGHLATVLSDLVGPEGQVVAVDPDAERIKIAKRENSRPNIQYSVANDQTFPGEGYDLIVSIHVIHWIKNKQAAFNRLYSKLAPGGSFGFVTMNDAPYHSPIVSKALNILISPDFEENLLFKIINFENKDAYEVMASASQFNIDCTSIIKKSQKFSNLEDLLDFFSGLSYGAFIPNDINKEILQKFKKDNLEELLSAQIDFNNMLCMVLKKRRQ